MSRYSEPMLSQLTIHNFAIVDRLEIDWQPGLNVITGETGAGKSILIDAVGALLGDRLGPDVVRSGASRALIEGVFTITDDDQSDLHDMLEEFGLEAEDGALIVSREIAGTGGRGGARVNGRAVPLSVLQQLGEFLVDVHGQSEHMALLRVRDQLEYLDRYAGATAERAELGRLIRDLRATREARRTLIAEERQTARLQDMLRHEVAEIDAADLNDREEEELLVQRARLQHVERLRQAAQTALQALVGAEEVLSGVEQPGATDLLARALAACTEGGKIDPSLSREAEALHAAVIQAEESARALRDYFDGIEADPQALERTAERLFLIGDLKRKYGETIADILAYAPDARRRLANIDNRAERLAELESREQVLVTDVAAAAGVLFKHRQAVAEQLATAVEAELADLRLTGARFVASIVQAVDADGIPLDRVEFLIGASPDDQPRPISRVASGGELARLALALKTVLSRVETRPTLIFDEIDAGVGGRTGPIVGEKLWAVARAGRQVLCVTHLPQVAAFADAHFAVARAQVTLLSGDERVEELAAMLAGTPTDAARHSARELLAKAAAARSAAQVVSFSGRRAAARRR